jgi:hypothetical protein
MIEHCGYKRERERAKRVELDALVDELIDELTAVAPFVREGTVMTMNRPQYRRLDCDRRALAYVRTRPRKGFVRIDLSELWLAPKESRLLVLATRDDKNDAIAFLLSAVEMTRRAQTQRTE